MLNVRLKELREEKGLSQTQLGQEIGVNWRTISNYEIGLREPKLEIIEKLCSFFEVSTDYLLGIEEN